MKKIISISLVVTLICALFVGCSSSSSFKDGKYKAEYSEADSHGWVDYVEITVEKSKITEVKYDSKNADGMNKSEDAKYAEMMKNAGSPTTPKEWFTKLAKDLVEKQKIDEVETVTGATNSSNDFKKLVKELEKNMKKGDTATLKVAR